MKYYKLNKLVNLWAKETNKVWKIIWMSCLADESKNILSLHLCQRWQQELCESSVSFLGLQMVVMRRPWKILIQFRLVRIKVICFYQNTVRKRYILLNHVLIIFISWWNEPYFFSYLSFKQLTKQSIWNVT